MVNTQILYLKKNFLNIDILAAEFLADKIF